MPSAIEWTDETWNPVVGCKMVSPGCANCYAQTMSKRLAAMAKADLAIGKDPGRKAHYLDVMTHQGKFNGAVRFAPEALGDPLEWKRPRRVFVNSMSDLFHEGMPFPYIDQVFGVMAATPRHTYQILTKRPERMAEYLATGVDGFRAGVAWDEAMQRTDGVVSGDWPLPNVWLGTSIENRASLDRAMHLAAAPAAVRFWSIEPLLEDLGNVRGYLEQNVDWVIVGGESGPRARPCRLDWVRSVVEQCREKGIAVFVKQLGAHVTASYYDDFREEWEGQGFDWPEPIDWRIRDGQPPLGSLVRLPLNDKKGGESSEWPEDLRVRELPAAVPANG